MILQSAGDLVTRVKVTEMNDPLAYMYLEDCYLIGNVLLFQVENTNEASEPSTLFTYRVTDEQRARILQEPSISVEWCYSNEQGEIITEAEYDALEDEEEEDAQDPWSEDFDISF